MINEPNLRTVALNDLIAEVQRRCTCCLVAVVAKGGPAEANVRLVMTSAPHEEMRLLALADLLHADVREGVRKAISLTTEEGR